VVTVTLNVGYVYIAVDYLAGSALVLVQVSLALFKVFWNSMFVSSALSRVSLGARVDLLSSVFAVLYTFIMSPVLATFFTDSTCFRYWITGEAVTALLEVPRFLCATLQTNGNFGFVPFNYPTCSFDSTEIMSTTVTPSWFYSNQCSSALVVNYAPVLIYSYLISGIMLPAVKVHVSQLDSERIGLWMPAFLMR
jgi:hypothetical protein